MEGNSALQVGLFCFLLLHTVAQSADVHKLHIGVIMELPVWFPPVEIAAEMINKNSQILPGYEIVLHRIDIDGDVAIASSQFTDRFPNETVIGLVGPVYYSNTLASSATAYWLNIVQVVMTWQRPAPENSFSVLPPFRTVGHASSNFLASMNWTTVLLGSSVAANYIDSSVHLERSLAEHAVKRLATIYVSDVTDYTAVVDNIEKDDIRVVLVHGSRLSVRFLCQAFLRGVWSWKRVFVANSGIRVEDQTIMDGRGNCTVEQMKEAAEGALFVTELDMPIYDPDVITKLGVKPGTVWEEAGRPDFTPTLSSYRAFDAMTALALGLHDAASAGTPLENFTYGNDQSYRSIRDSLDNVHFQGVSNLIDLKKDLSKPADALIRQYKGGSMRTIGIYNSRTGKVQLNFPLSDIWSHTPGKKTPLVADIKVSVNRPVPYAMRIIYICLAAISGVLAIAYCFVQLVYRNRTVVKYSWPLTNYLICLGVIVLDAFVIVRSLDLDDISADSFSSLCQVSLWLLILGIGLTVSAMTCKTWSIYRIFNMHQQSAEFDIKEGKTILAVFLLLLIDIIVATLWTGLNPFHSGQLHYAPEENENDQIVLEPYAMRCTGENAVYWVIGVVVIKSVVITVGAFLTWPSCIASLQKGFTESIYCGVCTYVCTLAILVGLPVAFIIKDDPIVQYGIIGALILLCTLTTAILMLIGKILAIRKERECSAGFLDTNSKSSLCGFPSVVAESIKALPGEEMNKVSIK